MRVRALCWVLPHKWRLNIPTQTFQCARGCGTPFDWLKHGPRKVTKGLRRIQIGR